MAILTGSGQGDNFRMPGGAFLVDIANSMKAMWDSKRATDVEMAKAIKDIKTSGHMITRFGDANVGRMVSGAAASMGDGTQGDPILPPTIAPTAERAHVPSTTSSGLDDIIERRQREFEGPDILPPASDFSAGYGAVRREGIAGLRKRVRQGMARSVSQMSLGGDEFDAIQVVRDANGNLMEVDDDYELGEGESYYRTLYQNSRTGEITQSGARAAMLGRRASGAGAIRNIATGLGQGKTLDASVANVSSTAGQALGTTAAVFTAAKYAADQAREQRAANIPYQSVTGGSNFGGFAPRVREGLLDFESYVFGGNPNADQIYRQAFGILPGDQNLAMDTVGMSNRLYRSIGYTNDRELISLVNTAVESGLEGIIKIADSLEGVSRAAEDAGLNAEEARKRWVDAFQSLAGVVGGEGAASTASVIAEGLTGLGPLGEGISIDTSEAGIQRLAAMNNLTYNQALSILSDPSRATEAAALFNNPSTNNIQSVFTPAGWQAVQATIGTPMSEGEIRAMADELLRNGGFADQRIIEQVLSFSGIEATGAAARTAAIQIARGDFARSSVQAAEAQVAEATPSSALPSQTNVDIDDRNQWARLSREGAALSLPFGQEARFGFMDLALPGGQRATNAVMGALGLGGETGQETANKKYQQAVERTGYRNPVIEQLISDYDAGQRYVVQTADGPVAVGMYELLDSFYEQALAYGVEFIGGDNSGTTFAERMGVTEQAATQNLDPQMRRQVERSMGQTYDGTSYDLEKLQREAREEAASGGTDTPTAEIRINAGPELERLINIEATGTDSRLSVSGADAGNLMWWQRATGG